MLTSAPFSRWRKASQSAPWLDPRELAALKAWAGSAASDAYYKVLELQSKDALDKIVEPGRTDYDYQRGRMAAYGDAYTLADRTIHLLEEYYDRLAARPKHTAVDARSKHIGSPHFWPS
jgi:hypothetical protein